MLRLADGGWILIYQRATANHGSELLLSCGFDSAFRTTVRGEREVVALALHPCGGAVLTGDHADTLARKRNDLTNMFPWASRLKERLDETDGIALCLTTMWECLRSQRNATKMWLNYRLAAEAIRGMDAVDGPSDIAHLARDLAVSTRTLERHVIAHTGLPPKRLARLRRLWRVVTATTAGQGTPWVEHAAQAGFSDQAHLIREFRSVYGMTPVEFRSLVGIRGVRFGAYAVLPVDLYAGAEIPGP
jgi:AraC-like DNA-binding protein